MSTIKFSEDHEWVSVDDGVATIGITNHAQEQLGDIVFVELPEVGRALSKGDDAAVVESVKAASEVYAPLSGEVTEINEALPDSPETVNSDPEGEGWFYKMTVGDSAEFEALMDAAAYKALVDSED